MVMAVVLAGGSGRRFRDVDPSAHKLEVPVDGVALITRSVGAAVAADIGPVVVVVGDNRFPGLVPDAARVVVNPEPGRGMASSLQVGIQAARDAGETTVVVGLADQPGVGSAAWRAVAHSVGTPVAIARFGSLRCPPTRLDAEVWPLLPTEGDDGARSLMTDRPELVMVVDCDGDGADIDTPEDVLRWN